MPFRFNACEWKWMQSNCDECPYGIRHQICGCLHNLHHISNITEFMTFAVLRLNPIFSFWRKMKIHWKLSLSLSLTHSLIADVGNGNGVGYGIRRYKTGKILRAKQELSTRRDFPLVHTRFFSLLVFSPPHSLSSPCTSQWLTVALAEIFTSFRDTSQVHAMTFRVSEQNGSGRINKSFSINNVNIINVIYIIMEIFPVNLYETISLHCVHTHEFIVYDNRTEESENTAGGITTVGNRTFISFRK